MSYTVIRENEMIFESFALLYKDEHKEQKLGERLQFLESALERIDDEINEKLLENTNFEEVKHDLKLLHMGFKKVLKRTRLTLSKFKPSPKKTKMLKIIDNYTVLSDMLEELLKVDTSSLTTTDAIAYEKLFKHFREVLAVINTSLIFVFYKRKDPSVKTINFLTDFESKMIHKEVEEIKDDSIRYLLSNSNELRKAVAQMKTDRETVQEGVTSFILIATTLSVAAIVMRKLIAFSYLYMYLRVKKVILDIKTFIMDVSAEKEKLFEENIDKVSDVIEKKAERETKKIVSQANLI